MRLIESHLLVLVVVASILALVAPALGRPLMGAVAPMLALLMFSVALTFDRAALGEALRRPGLQALATVLVFVPMSLIALALATWSFGSGNYWLGIILLGVLPTDVSSPLLVYIARGNVALATTFNAINTAVSPVVVPLLFVAYTGVRLDVPIASIIGEVAAVVVMPTAVGVTLRTLWPMRIRRWEPALSATASLTYVALVLAVVGSNASVIRSQPATVLIVVLVCVMLNTSGYGLALAARPFMSDVRDRTAMLFTVSKKEFSIAAMVVAASGLPADVALPAAIYAVVQMTTSPAVAGWLARHADDPPGTVDPSNGVRR